MDPTANLREQLELAEAINNGTADEGDAERLAELVEALDAWMKRGGFAPTQWARKD